MCRNAHALPAATTHRPWMSWRTVPHHESFRRQSSAHARRMSLHRCRPDAHATILKIVIQAHDASSSRLPRCLQKSLVRSAGRCVCVRCVCSVAVVYVTAGLRAFARACFARKV